MHNHRPSGVTDDGFEPSAGSPEEIAFPVFPSRNPAEQGFLGDSEIRG
jgi:hypothetical protein